MIGCLFILCFFLFWTIVPLKDAIDAADHRRANGVIFRADSRSNDAHYWRNGAGAGEYHAITEDGSDDDDEQSALLFRQNAANKIDLNEFRRRRYSFSPPSSSSYSSSSSSSFPPSETAPFTTIGVELWDKTRSF